MRDELPHSIAVVVQDIAPREDSDLTDIFADIVVERDSQKAIIIGHKGSRLADVGTRSRAGIEPLDRIARLPVVARPSGQGVAARSRSSSDDSGSDPAQHSPQHGQGWK